MPKKSPQRRLSSRSSVNERSEKYLLSLCIAGMTARSRQALGNIQRICDEYLKGRYQLEVIDLYQQPEFAARLQVIATPTLVKRQPAPLRRLVGSLANQAEALQKLGIISHGR